MATHSCSTNKHTYAPHGDSINFGGVNSCMTITCTLANGDRVAGHFSTETDSHRVTDEHARDFLLTLMKTEITSHRGSVNSVLAKGSLQGWTPDMLPQQVMTARAQRRFPNVHLNTAADELAFMPHIVEESLGSRANDFKDFINHWFGCPQNSVQMEEWSEFGQDLVV